MKDLSFICKNLLETCQISREAYYLLRVSKKEKLQINSLDRFLLCCAWTPDFETEINLQKREMEGVCVCLCMWGGGEEKGKC